MLLKVSFYVSSLIQSILIICFFLKTRSSHKLQGGNLTSQKGLYILYYYLEIVLKGYSKNFWSFLLTAYYEMNILAACQTHMLKSNLQCGGSIFNSFIYWK